MKVISITIVAGILFLGCSNKGYYYLDEKYGKNYKDYNAPKNKKELNVNNNPTDFSKLTPYVVFGKQYYPNMVEIGNEFSGIASWYGRDFHSKLTANGEVYDMYALTAAHKTLPMNTIVKVTNTTNDKTVVVRINDRGPFKDARIIDLSFTAAKEIAMDNVGTAPVKLEILGFDGTIAAQGSVKQNRIIGNLMLQIGAYNFYENAIDSVNKYSSIDSNYKAILKTYDNNGVPFYRVMIAGFKSETEVRDFAKRNNLRDSFIVAE